MIILPALLALPALWGNQGGRETASAQSAFDKALHFLVQSQNKDGSWGRAILLGPADDFSWNPEVHRVFQRATSALCCLALMENGTTPECRAAVDRTLHFLVEQSDVARPSDWEVYNTWAYGYSLQVLARAYGDSHYKDDPFRLRMKEAAERCVALLNKYQTPNGGWGYYDFETFAQRPSWATSFTTAAILIALVEARGHGIAVEDKMIDRAAKAVARCKLPSGAYTYSVEATPSPGGMEWIDQIKGSLSRIQVGNVALFLAGEKISKDDFKRGLENFFQYHKFLDVARRRPIPHEAYYFNSGYFYFFGHHYAAMAIEQLDPKDRPYYWSLLQKAIVSCQEADGSMWDWYLTGYYKPYGTAFAVMALGRSLK